MTRKPINLIFVLSLVALPAVAVGDEHAGKSNGLEASWVVDPTVPGQDLPPKGRSLFDMLFTVERGGQRFYDVPFPFTELIKRIDQHLPKDKAGRSNLKRVLIPLGRSLQRHAAAPNYFANPRIVVAVDREPDRSGALLLKDRLFLGYQAKANIIEVISYNEESGRFEFQVVRDYGPGLNSRVFYARRTICTSCHQNGGPIFSKAAWSETNSNPKVAGRLWNEQRTYHGVPINRAAVAPFVDAATDRANLFSAYQLLWGEGCGGNVARAKRCRAAALVAMLQYRLSGRAHFDTRSPEYRNQFLALSKENWRTRWPGGIKIPNPDIPDRDPLSADGRITAGIDPLTLRPPLEIWSGERPGDVERVIKGLSGFISTPDLQALDTGLFDRGQESNRTKQQSHSTCELNAKPLSDAAHRVDFMCRIRAEDNNGGFGMKGQFYLESDSVTDGVIDSLQLNDGPQLEALDIPGGTLLFDGRQWTVNLRLHHRRTGLHARLPNGNALEHVELRWTHSASTDNVLHPVPAQPRFSGDAILSVMDDFTLVRTAVAELSNLKEQNPFSSTPFRVTRTMRALFSRLGVVVDKNACCEELRMPAARVDSEDLPIVRGSSSTLAKSGGLQVFERYCASCHRTEAPFPPNFLYGNVDRVAANLTQCAHRIWYRLHMWQLPEEQRPKTPMPPITTLHASKLSVERWRESDGFADLRKHVTELLRSQNDELLHRDYETLPACLPKS